jgi:putative restriction endonuclease
MPAISPTELVNSILDAIQQSGGSGVYVSNSLQIHPRKFVVQHLDRSFSVWIYIWTLTHGGGSPRPKNEYRIQLTTVQPPLKLNPNGYTLLLGYYPDLEIFAGFDIQKHLQFTAGSPSIQIGFDALQKALLNGLSFYQRTNNEIVVGIRPDQFLSYILNAKALHNEGPSAKNLLEKAAELEDVEQEATEEPPERQRVVTEVSRLSRDANFRRKVLDAYENRCAVTRMQLRLVDAAHILPVAVEGSTDETTNGIALSPTMHRAFDNALIYIDDEHKMQLNKETAYNLQNKNLSHGLFELKGWLDRRIHLPADRQLRPDIDLVNKANGFRQIPGY